MEMLRKTITEFMKKYFEAYSTIAQDPKENHRMSEYYSPDFAVTVYVGHIAECGGEEFLFRSSSHPGIQEILTPGHMIVDEEQGMLGVLVHCKLIARATRALIREMWFSAHYKITLDERGNLKIEHLWLFAQYSPRGEKSIFEMYGEEMRSLSAEGPSTI
jgi:hypothetical protein